MDNECELVSLARDNALDGGSLATDGGAATVRERGADFQGPDSIGVWMIH